jgi:molybdate transport system substrate-binding protein
MKLRIAGLALAAALLAQTASGAEIKVLSAGAIEPGLRAAAQAFQRQTGHVVTITFATAPQIRTRVGGGETADVVIAPPAVLEELARTGKIGQRVTVGRVGLGVAIRPGAPAPDIATAETLQRSVLAAESLVFNRASTGLYFENLLKRWGIYEQVESKTTRYPNGASVLDHVLRGQGREIGFGAITEIMLYRDRGLRFVGPLPAAVQNYTTYEAAPMTPGTQAQVSREFVTYLGSPAGKALFVAAGIE